MVSRQERRARARSTAKDEDGTRVYIVVPEEFTDCMGDSWNTQTSDGIVALDFLDVLLATVRRSPVQSAEDSERALELIHALRAPENGFVELRKADYEWMMSQFKASAHKLWTAPDAAHLRKTIEAAVSAKKPEGSKGEASA